MTTTHQPLCDYNFQAFNFDFKSYLLSNRFGGTGRSRGSCVYRTLRGGDCKPQDGIQWKLFQKHLLVWWVYFSFTSTFFSSLQFNLHKKQAVLFCLQKYVRVGVYTRAREMSIVRGEEGGIEEEAQIMLALSFQASSGPFSLLESRTY